MYSYVIDKLHKINARSLKVSVDGDEYSFLTLPAVGPDFFLGRSSTTELFGKHCELFISHSVTAYYFVNIDQETHNHLK